MQEFMHEDDVSKNKKKEPLILRKTALWRTCPGSNWGPSA